MKQQVIIPLSEALPGMRLANAVTDEQGRVLVQAQAEISESMLQGLARRNIAQLSIEQEVEEEDSVRELRLARLDELLAQRFRKAGETVEGRQLQQAVFDFLKESV